MTERSPERYDAWYRTGYGRWVGGREYQLLRESLAAAAADSMLDVGCGTGYFTRLLARDHDAMVVGVDPDRAAVEYASHHAERAETYIVARGEALPFASRAFDVSVSITALCFVVDQARFLREIVRVTRRRIAVGLLNRRSILWQSKGQADSTSAYHGAHWHTREEIEKLLAAVGCVNISLHTAINLPSGNAVARLLERMIPSSSPWGGFLLAVGDVAARVAI